MTTRQAASGREPSAREICVDILAEVLERGKYTHTALSQALSKYQYLKKQDRSFIKRVVDGTVEYLIQIDFILNTYSKVKVEKMKPVIRTILRMSVYQICRMDRIPDSAACDEAVKLAVRRGFSSLRGFVNGVLRNVSRGKETLSFPSEEIRLSMPGWLLSHFTEECGRRTAVLMAESFLADSPLTVRLALNLAPREEIEGSLAAQGVETEPSGYAEDVIRLTHVDYLEGLEAFRRGWIQVQDLSSSLAGDAAGIRRGDQVLDVCGAPGGKAIHAAELLGGTGLVTVRDVSAAKTAMIEENIRRSGLLNIRAEVFDALTPDETFVGKADVVLADLPCSGLGVIGRKPDIKYRMTPEQIGELAELQRQILSVVWRYVKPGGTLVYSTCTISRRENEENLAWFLEQFPFTPVNLLGRLGERFSSGTMEEGYIRLLPGVHPCDGFFISVMKRNI